MQRQVILGLLTLEALWGCGNGSDDARLSDNPSVGGHLASAGGASSLGGSTSGNTSTVENAGSQQFSAGGTTPNTKGLGGASPATSGVSIGGVASDSTGGRTENAAGGSEATAGTSNSGPDQCPEWPQNKLLPTIGIYFYGSVPGPCSSTTSSPTVTSRTDYAYANGQIVSTTKADQQQEYTWSEGVLVSHQTKTATGTTSGQYTWTKDAVIDTYSTGAISKYVLDPNGYPSQILVGDPSSALVLAVTFEYTHCRLTRRVQYAGDGSVDARNTSNFDYDGFGRIVTQRFGSGLYTTFDYSCW